MKSLCSIDKRAVWINVLMVALNAFTFSGCASEGEAATETSWISFPSGIFVDSDGTSIEIASFDMSATETTVSQFVECVDSGACSLKNFSEYDGNGNEFCNYGRTARREHPMNCVNWKGAAEYCAWKGGRLPTEAEWEYASTHDGRIEMKTVYPWGNDLPVHCIHDNYVVFLNEIELVYCDGREEVTSIVGTSAIGTHLQGNSPRGLQNMGANVSEWTSSLRESSSEAGETMQRYVYKGADFSRSNGLEVAASSSKSAEEMRYEIGFRCIVSN